MQSIALRSFDLCCIMVNPSSYIVELSKGSSHLYAVFSFSIRCSRASILSCFSLSFAFTSYNAPIFSGVIMCNPPTNPICPRICGSFVLVASKKPFVGRTSGGMDPADELPNPTSFSSESWQSDRG